MGRQHVAAYLAIVLLAAGCSRGTHSAVRTATSTVAATAKARNGQTVTVVLNDRHGNRGPMTMAASPNTVSAGTIRFEVRNTGTVPHEMVVIRTTHGSTLLVNSSGYVSEVGAVGSIRNIAPNQSKTLTLTLSAGKYELVCNLKAHYALGMRVPLTIT
jgi:uncharacterized cupredoxin-like copper-binding protein